MFSKPVNLIFKFQSKPKMSELLSQDFQRTFYFDIFVKTIEYVVYSLMMSQANHASLQNRGVEMQTKATFILWLSQFKSQLIKNHGNLFRFHQKPVC
jgi:hypothetical protein